MKRTLQIALPLSFLIVVLWALGQPAEVLNASASFMPMRKAYTLLTGSLALGWMSFSMLLALRPAWLERRLGGLDQLFKVHKWVGIISVLLVVAHWLLILSPRTLATWGWIEMVAREGRPHGAGGHEGGASLVGLAKQMGEWAAWLMIVLGIVALLRFIPYGWFRKVHKGFPIAFLFGAFHSITMLPDGTATTPFGLLVIGLSLAGSGVALFSLAGWVGRSRQHKARISGVSLTEAGVLDLQVTPGADWAGHKAGQFALLTLDRKEGPHPFTIVSDWKHGAALRFAIKPLGNYTRTLADRVHIGDSVIVEGPYGCFDFGEITEEQVWVAGGIGVAPFIARLEWLAARGGAQGKVHLFYGVKNSKDATFPLGLEDLCWHAGVQLHLRIDAVDGQIDPAEIGQLLPSARGVWFCGPSDWGRLLRSVLQRRYGLAPAQFYQERFEFR